MRFLYSYHKERTRAKRFIYNINYGQFVYLATSFYPCPINKYFGFKEYVQIYTSQDPLMTNKSHVLEVKGAQIAPVEYRTFDP